jgi:hypothetical protein
MRLEVAGATDDAMNQKFYLGKGKEGVAFL